ncbi:MAG: O-antigen ligase family protein [Deltaproteobacteria bacterium]|nr:O-antigen ligase family protein [Deltaproteobacteria bacterium]
MTLFGLYDNKLNILGYIVIPLCLGLIIAFSDWRFGIGLGAIILFFCLGPRIQCYMLIVSIFYPLVLTIGPINEFPVSLIITPLFLISMLSFMLLNGHPIRLGRDSRPFIFAFCLLLLCLVIGYAKNTFSVFSINLGDHESKMVGLSYLTTFTGIMVFLSASWYFSIAFFDENRLLRFFIIIATVLALFKFTGLASILFDTSFNQPYITASGAKRMGGFDNLVWLAVPALMAYTSQRVNTLRIFLIVVYLVFGIMSGGRALFFGIVFATIIYLSLFYKKYSARLVLAGGIIILTMALMAQFVSLPTQIRRISGLTMIEEGGFAQQDPGRAVTFSYFWNIFLDNPLFGKGIGIYNERMPERLSFINEQLISGGHGAYLSILAIFGIVGAVFLALILFGTVYKSYRIILMNSLDEEPVAYKKTAIFIFLYSLVAVFYYVFGFSGFQDLKLYFVIGMLVGILEKRERHTHIIED